MNIKIRSLLAAAVVLSLAVPGMASADRRGGDRHHDRGDRHGYRHGYRHHYRERLPAYRYYPGRGVPRYYRYDDDDDLVTGLVLGGILGYAINGAQHSAPYGYNDPYPRAQPNTYPPDSYAYSDDTCLQEREYQTTVVVGGKHVPAYGTACLQPDGSWRRGPPQTVNY